MPVVRQILAAATGASASDEVSVEKPEFAKTIMAKGTLTGAETIGDVQIKDSGGSWVDYYYNGTQVQLSDTQTAIMLEGIGTYRVNKGVTTAAVGIDVYERGSPLS